MPVHIRDVHPENFAILQEYYEKYYDKKKPGYYNIINMLYVSAIEIEDIFYRYYGGVLEPANFYDIENEFAIMKTIAQT